MKNDAQRIASYLAKTVPATVSLKVASMLGGMKTGFAASMTGLTGLADTETLIQGVLNDANVPTIQYPFYLNFGREIWSKQRLGVDGPTLVAVAQSLHDKYEAYGLATATLVDIADQVFHIAVI